MSFRSIPIPLDYYYIFIKVTACRYLKNSNHYFSDFFPDIHKNSLTVFLGGVKKMCKSDKSKKCKNHKGNVNDTGIIKPEH